MQAFGKKKRQFGFTLIELMIVVAIIGILAAIAIPQFLIFSGKAKRAEAVLVLRSIHSAETTYFGSYDTYLSGTLASASTALALGPIALKYYNQGADIYGCGLFCPAIVGHCPTYLALLSGNLDNDPTDFDQVAIQQDNSNCPTGVPIPSGIATVTYDDLI